MICPKCKERMQCIDSRPMPYNTTKRVYKCLCGIKIKTIETIIKEENKNESSINK